MTRHLEQAESSSPLESSSEIDETVLNPVALESSVSFFIADYLNRLTAFTAKSRMERRYANNKYLMKRISVAIFLEYNMRCQKYYFVHYNYYSITILISHLNLWLLVLLIYAIIYY